MSITIDIVHLKQMGLFLFPLAIIALYAELRPDQLGSVWKNITRWMFWPAFLIWFAAFFIRGLVL